MWRVNPETPKPRRIRGFGVSALSSPSYDPNRSEPPLPRTLSLVIPEGVIVIAAVALARFGASITGFAQVAEWLPVIVVVVGAGVAWRFRRGRLLAGLGVLVPLWGWVVVDPVASWRLPLALSIAGVLTVVGWSREKGFRGVYLLAMVGALIGVGLYSIIATRLPVGTPGPLADFFAWSALPPSGAAAMVVALAALLTASLVRADGVAQGALWGVVAAWGALVIGERAGALIIVAGGGAALVAGTLESIFAAAYRDALTGLPSRRALDEILDGLPEGSVVAMVDVDHFKQFNDTYGHDTGDQVLRMVAWRLNEVPDVQAFRYGGEEFTLVFTSMSLKDALARFEGARAAVAASRFMLRSGDRPKGKKGKEKRGVEGGRHGLSVTISIGVAVRGPKEQAQALLKRADEALYAAKESGRDRVLASKG
jgi:diguanylate cyclase (GGDEF)-like protein